MARHAAGLVACLGLAGASHGYLFYVRGALVLPPDRFANPARILEDRSLVVDRAPPEVVWHRVPRGKFMTRLGHLRVPGVELWRDCKTTECRGVTVAVASDGRILDTPELMARVPHWPLKRQVQLRMGIIGHTYFPNLEQLRVLRCGEVVWAQVPRSRPWPTAGDREVSMTETRWFRFRTGEWGMTRRNVLLDCGLRTQDIDVPPGWR